MKVARAPSVIRDLIGLPEQLRGSLIHTGGRRWGPQERWNYFGTAGQPGFIAPWGPHTAATGYNHPRWFRDQRDRVHFSGLLYRGAGSTATGHVLTMPIGLRPPTTLRWLAVCDSDGSALTRGIVTLSPGGELYVFPASNSDWISIDCLHYSFR